MAANSSQDIWFVILGTVVGLSGFSAALLVARIALVSFGVMKGEIGKKIIVAAALLLGIQVVFALGVIYMLLTGADHPKAIVPFLLMVGIIVSIIMTGQLYALHLITAKPYDVLKRVLNRKNT